MSESWTTICIYRVKPGHENDFEDLLRRHGRTLRTASLVTATSNAAFRSRSHDQPVYVETIEWVERDAPTRAHEMPEVGAVWQPMSELCEERKGHQAMEFIDVEPVQL